MALMTGISRVETQTKDRSQTVAPVSTSTGAFVVYADKGEINKPILITRGEHELTDKFGAFRLENGYDLLAAKVFSRYSNSLYVVRVVSGEYAYPAGVFGENLSSNDFEGFGFAPPTYANGNEQDPDGAVEFIDSASRNEAFLVRSIGPGARERLAVTVNSLNMPPFTAAAVLEAEPLQGSALPIGSYSYRVIATNSLGKTEPTPAGSPVTIDASNNSAKVSFERIPSASGYLVYRSTGSGDYYEYAYVNQPPISQSTVNFIDRGQFNENENSELPTSGFYAPIAEFTINVFDLDESENTPVETIECSFEKGVDGFGEQTGVEEKVNALSNLIRIKRNPLFFASNLTADNKPVIFPMPVRYTLTGGKQGDDFSSMDVGERIAAWDLFANEEKYQIRLAGDFHAPLAVKLKLAELARDRQDFIAYFDVPSSMQDAGNAVNYRSNVLNVDSDRARLTTPDFKMFVPEISEEVWVPPSLRALALRAQADARYNVWTPIAGLEYGLMDGVVELRHTYSQTELNLLADAQINPIKENPTFYLPEQLTLARRRSALSYESVRRMVDTIELAVKDAYAASLQNPNDDILVRQLINLIGSFLEPVRISRGISRYEVISDESNNPSAVISNAQRNIDVAIWPILPVRYIRVVMNLMKDGVEFTEFLVE